MNYLHMFTFCIMAVLEASGRKKILNIGGIFPGTESIHPQHGREASLTAAKLALQDVNHTPNLLPGYQLHLHWKYSTCNSDVASASVFNDMLTSDPMKLMILEGCLTPFSRARNLSNLVWLSFGASSPASSDEERFSAFFQMHPGHTIQNSAVVQFLQKFKWSKVAFLQQEGESFNSAAVDLELDCNKHGIEIVTQQLFLDAPEKAALNLKPFGVQPIVAMLKTSAARKVLCEIYKSRSFGENYIWFFPGDYEQGWHKNYLTEENLNCTEQEMNLAVEGHITIEVSTMNQINWKTIYGISGMTADDFRERLNDALRTDQKNYLEEYWVATLAYDAVWSVSLALNNTIQQFRNVGRSFMEGFNYDSEEIANLLYQAMNETDFLGVSGRVAFNEDGSRKAWTRISQIVNGSYRLLGYHDYQSSKLTWFNEDNWIIEKELQNRAPNFGTAFIGFLISIFSFASLLALSLIL